MPYGEHGTEKDNSLTTVALPHFCVIIRAPVSLAGGVGWVGACPGSGFLSTMATALTPATPGTPISSIWRKLNEVRLDRKN